MAVLNSEELRQLREVIAQLSGTVTWNKSQVNAAVQSVVNRLELTSTQNTISSDIEGAAPGVFNATQKRRIFVLATLITARQAGVF